ncbi:MAG: DUF190 domain-containing protein [Bacillota bacterium]
MKVQGKGKLIKIYTSESHKYKSKPLYQVIVERAKKDGMAGITVYRGIEGFGMHHKIHSTHILTLSDDLPLVLEIVDRAEKINQFLCSLDELIKEGLVMVVDDIHIIKYS